MRLLTDELREKLPPLGASDDEQDPMVICKFLTPDSSWTWYAIEFDGGDVFYGWVIGHFAEFGAFRLSELESLRGPWGLPIERDLYFQPKRLSEVQQEEERVRGELL